MQLYHVYNTSRSQRTRTRRYGAPTHGGMLQFLGGRRIIRGRPTVFTKEELEGMLDEVKRKKAEGMLDVRTPDGREVDLNTFKAAPPPPPPPTPKPPVDDVRKDKPTGIAMPIYEDGAVQADNFEKAETPTNPGGKSKEEPGGDEPDEVEYHEPGTKTTTKRKRRR